VIFPTSSTAHYLTWSDLMHQSIPPVYSGPTLVNMVSPLLFPALSGQDVLLTLASINSTIGARYCGMASPVLKNSIILSLWGLVTPELVCNWWTTLHDFGSCPIRRHPGLIPSDHYFPPCHVPGKVGSAQLLGLAVFTSASNIYKCTL